MGPEHSTRVSVVACVVVVGVTRWWRGSWPWEVKGIADRVRRAGVVGGVAGMSGWVLRAVQAWLSGARNAVAMSGGGPALLVAAAAAVLWWALKRRAPPRGGMPRPPVSTAAAVRGVTDSTVQRRARPRRLAGVRCLTIGGDIGQPGALFSIDPSHGVRPRIVVNPEECPALRRLAALVDLYIITRVTSDEDEDAVLRALIDAGIPEAGLNVDKVVFCETVQGRVSIVR